MPCHVLNGTASQASHVCFIPLPGRQSLVTRRGVEGTCHKEHRDRRSLRQARTCSSYLCTGQRGRDEQSRHNLRGLVSRKTVRGAYGSGACRTDHSGLMVVSASQSEGSPDSSSHETEAIANRTGGHPQLELDEEEVLLRPAGAQPEATLAPPQLIAGGAVLLLLPALATAAILIPGGPPAWIHWGQDKLKDAADAAEHAGPLAPVYFGGAYVMATIFLLPASVLTVAAGYIFGTLPGTAIVSVASTSGAALAFLISRYAARPLVTAQLAKLDKFAIVDRAISEDGWKIVFLWRLSPLFPFAVSNYMFGLTGVGFGPYVAASWIAMLPATFTYVYLGGAGRATVDAIESGSQTTEYAKLGLYVVGAIATLLVTKEISTRASAALKRAEDDHHDTD